nr:amidohydrolase family protein [Sphingobium subterraneum]
MIDNVNGITTDAMGRLERFTGLMIDDDGRVVSRLAAGDQRPAYPRFKLDGKGRTLIPAFVDAQAHLVETGLTLMTVDLSGARSLAEAQTKITEDLRATPDRKWILGRGWDAKRWGLAAPPSAADLDGVTGGTPALLTSADGESLWANSAALRAAGVTKAMAVDEMQRRLRSAAPQPAPKDRDLALDKAQRLFLAAGYGAVVDTALSIEDWQSLRRAGDRGALRLRVAGYARSLADLVTIAGPEPTPWLYDGRLRLVGASFRLRAPAPAPTSPQATALLNQMSRAAMDGFQVGLDMGPTDAPALRDAALDMFTEMDATYKGDRRWRLDLLPPDAPSQPVKSITFLYSAPAVLTRGSMGSGSPASRPGPFALLAMMVKPEDAASRGAALTALTRQPAYAAYADKEFGALETGQRADFLLIDRDITTAAPAEIAGTQVLEIWVGGRQILTK